MKKKKRENQIKQSKKGFILQVFGLGVAVGFILHWVPLNTEFTTAKFSKNEWTKEEIISPFLPTTSPVLKKKGFVISYNGQTRNPNWVYHKLTSKVFENRAYRLNSEFQEDLIIPQHIRSMKNDYQGEGFDRGHLCPAADCASQESTNDSFLLTNISPQVPSFNRGHWKKLENHVRDLTHHFSTVHIFSGPLYLSKKGRDGKTYVKYQVIGKNHIAVPTHFFMTIFAENSPTKIKTKSYILPNTSIDPNISLSEFSASIEDIENASGILFTHILNE